MRRHPPRALPAKSVVRAQGRFPSEGIPFYGRATPQREAIPSNNDRCTESSTPLGRRPAKGDQRGFQDGPGARPRSRRGERRSHTVPDFEKAVMRVIRSTLRPRRARRRLSALGVLALLGRLT